MVKSAHIAVVTPRRCGLYETTRELVAALRLIGVDSRIIDPNKNNPLHPHTEEDRGAPFADEAWAKTADVLINHSGLGEMHNLDIPVIHIAHGRPRSSFITEVKGGTPIYTYHYEKNKEPKFRAVVTFWSQHVPYLRVMWPDKPIYTVTAPVDLEAWSPNGPSGYKFGGHHGTTNIVCTDAWRDDVDPFVAVNAFALWARNHPGARLHLYGNDKIAAGWGALIRRIQDDGNMGEIKGWILGLEHVYRAADLLITPHTIDTRSVREAMACGCPVARIGDDIQAGIHRINNALRLSRQAMRRQAEEMFNPAHSASQFKLVIDDVLRTRKAA